MTLHTRHHCRDEGAVSIVVAVLVPSLLLLLALVVDGADRLRALAHADAVAAATARSALTALDTRGEVVTVARGEAVAAARTYLAATDHTGHVRLDATGTVHVIVSHTEPAALGLFGPTHHVTGHATVRLVVDTSAAGGQP